MNQIYKIIAGFYNLIDVIYFRKDGTNPRKAIVNYIPDKKARVLDICTGTASNSIIIAEHRKKASIVGIDISRDMLRIASQKIKSLGLSNLKVKYADATDTKLKDDSVDIIVISLVLHEVSKDLADKILSEAGRILKSDGKILVLEWEQPTDFLQKVLFLPILLLEPNGFCKFLHNDKKKYFAEHGFNIKSMKHCDYTCVYELSKQYTE